MFIRATNPDTGGTSPFAVGELVRVHYATDGKAIEGDFNAYKKNLSTQEWELEWTEADFNYSWWVYVEWWYPEGFWKVEFVDRVAGISPSVEFTVGDPPVPLCPIGEQTILELCPDGETPKRWKRCLPEGFEDREIVEVYRGVVIYKRQGVHYEVFCYTRIEPYHTCDKHLDDLKREIDKDIDYWQHTFPVGKVWLEYQQECDEEKSLVTFTVEAEGVGRIAGASITVNGTNVATNANGEASFTAHSGKAYTARCTAPAGYECVVCTSTFTAPKDFVGFVLKVEEVVGCSYGDVKPGSTIYCKDGVTWKSREICDAYGNWKMDMQKCPDEPENEVSMLYLIFDFVENMLDVDRKTAEMITYLGIVGVVIVALGAMFGKK